MYYLCCFRQAPFHLSHTSSHICHLLLVESRKPHFAAIARYYVTVMLQIETFIFILLIVRSRLNEFRCGRSRTMQLVIYRKVWVMRGKWERVQWTNEDERALGAPVCSPVSKRVWRDLSFVSKVRRNSAHAHTCIPKNHHRHSPLKARSYSPGFQEVHS